jgi:hypothetical protein
MSLTTALIIDGVIVLAMIGVSLYGASVLPPGARMPVHFGPTGYNQWVPKGFGLALWPAVAAGVCVILAVTTRRHHPGSSSAAVIVIVLLLVMLVTEIGALTVARTRGDR